MLLPMAAFTQAKGAEQQLSHVAFVKSFYSWYVPLALQEMERPASDIALQLKGHLFSPELRKALKADSAAQAKVTDDIVGLDFDPFLNSQDPAHNYKIGKTEKKGTHFFVNIHAVLQPGRLNSKPDVVAELSLRDDRWEFVDFWYPGDVSLLVTLQNLAAARVSN